MTKQEFEARVIGMRDTLYRVSATMLFSQFDREDAIQECVLKALSHRERLRDDRAMQGWVVRILINECRQIYRRRKRETPMEALPEPEPAPDADQEVFRALFSLPEKLRLPMVLYYADGYHVDEIARILRLPTGTIKSRLSRGRKALKQALGEE